MTRAHKTPAPARHESGSTVAAPSDHLMKLETAMSVAAPALTQSHRRADRTMLLHPVGTAPAGTGGDPLSTMQWHLDNRHGALLDALPFDIDDRWIIEWLNARADVPGLVKIREGDSRGYDDMPCYGLAAGHQLTSADLALGRPALTAQAFAATQHLTGDDIPARLQVSIPNALDLSVFASGSPEASGEWMPPMQAMVTAEVTEIDRCWGDHVTLQLESPAILAAYQRTRRVSWELLTGNLVTQVADILAAAPHATWTLHLCVGDLEHTPLVEPVDLSSAAMFLNTLSDLLVARGMPMPTIHLPIAYGGAPPSIDPAFYAPLRLLRRGIDVIAGLVAEDHPERTRTALGLVVDALGAQPVGIAAGCGHGRRSPAAGAANAALAASITQAWTSS